MSDAENPLDPFKRATTATIRAIAGDDELDVTFGAGPPVVRGGTLRLPLPAVGASQSEIDAVRGMGDEFALRFRHHDTRLHARYSPEGGPAQEMFEWIESARIASIGAVRMQGRAAVSGRRPFGAPAADGTGASTQCGTRGAVLARPCNGERWRAYRSPARACG